MALHRKIFVLHNGLVDTLFSDSSLFVTFTDFDGGGMHTGLHSFASVT